MGTKFTDSYSFLHLCVGSISRYFNIPLYIFIILHILFEIIENTEIGMKIIRKIKIWPGGKTHADSILNRIGDIFYGIIGWIIADIFLKDYKL